MKVAESANLQSSDPAAGHSGSPEPHVGSAVRVLDAFGRPLANLRVSVTDRCNLRCQYCMPEEEYVWLPREEILNFEEVRALVEIFSGLGVVKVRLTGGEPLLRRDLDQLLRMLAANPLLRDLALTTNGLLLGQYAQALREAGLHRLTVSLDTLRPERFRALVRRDGLAEVLQGIATACAAGFSRIKLNAVVIRGFNDDELADLIDYGRGVGVEVRFIEYMDVGGATRWSLSQVVSRAEMLQRIESRFGTIEALHEDGTAPADRFVLPDGTRFGIISSTTSPFCGSCDRARLMPDGMWLLCLYAERGIDLKGMLRGGAHRGEIAQAIAGAWRGRTDRGAEQRKALNSRNALFRVEDLRQDPHREMHTRGG
ncbi:MAG TPA: GTP 3',8-cyclase MoaA [Terriglobia bacterium]|nr:GTP 3',8-cyclase MoaA [Terriglobia bacterium]